MKYTTIAFLVLICTQLLVAQAPELRIPSAHHTDHFRFGKNDKILVSEGEKEIKIWDVENNSLLKSIPLPPAIDSAYDREIFLFQEDTKACFVYSAKARVLNLTTYQWEKTIYKLPEEPSVSVMTKDGQSLYYATFGKNDRNALSRFDFATGKSAKILDFKAEETGFTIAAELNADETMLLANGFENDGILFDLKNKKILKKYKSPDYPLFFNAKNNLIVSVHRQPEDDASRSNPQYAVREVEPISGKVLRETKFTFQSDDIPDYNNILFISHDHHERILYQANERFISVDVNTFKASPRFDASEGKSAAEGVYFLSDYGKYAFNAFDLTLRNPETGRKIKSLGFFTYLPFNITQIDEEKQPMLLVGSQLLTFNPQNFSVRKVAKGFEADWLQRSIYRYLPESKEVISASSYDNDYAPNRFSITTPDAENVPIDLGLAYGVIEARIYEKDNLAILASSDRFFTVNTKTWRVKQHIVFDESYRSAHFSRVDDSYIMELSPDKSKVIFHLVKTGETGDETQGIGCFDLALKKMTWYYDAQAYVSNPVYENNGREVWAINDKNEVLRIDAETGKLLKKSSPLQKEDVIRQRWSQSHKYILADLVLNEQIFGTSGFDVFDNATGKKLYRLPMQAKAYTNATFMDRDRYLVTQDEDLKIWEAATGKLILRIIIPDHSEDWIALTPDGRFDGSKGGLAQMYYLRGNEKIPLEQLSEGFYTPGLVADALAGNAAPPKKDIKDIKLPPTVKIGFNTTQWRNLVVEDDDAVVVAAFEVNDAAQTIQISADALDDALAEIRLFQNGKLISSINLQNESPKQFQRGIDLTLSAGANHIRAVAINSQRTESRPFDIILKYTPPKTEKKEGLTMHLVVIGINAYKNPKYSLNYAEADAKAFKESVEAGAKGIFSNVSTTFILNEQATKSGIVAALDKVKSSAKSQDLFLFYYAGHGVMNDQKEFFIVPQDVTQLYGNDNALAQKGLSAAELQQYSKEIKAQKQLFILDACQSAGALETVVASRGAAEEKAIAQLARSTGTHWLTASGSEQFASEFTQLGHGAFTYALLEAFKGLADSGGDKRLTINELDVYLQEKVPEITAKYKGTPQYPASYGYGQDFPIIIIR